MLSSVARPVGRIYNSVRSTQTVNNPSSKLHRSKPTTNVYRSSNINTAFTRNYAAHGHHEEAPKPYKRTVLSPRLADAARSAEESEREVKGIEGWIFGRKVSYIDPLKPIEDTVEQKTANGYMFNQKPRGDGQGIVWEDWEPLTYIGTALCVLVVAIGIWARPENNVQVWATEEARERKIIKARQELVEKQEQQEASL